MTTNQEAILISQQLYHQMNYFPNMRVFDFGVRADDKVKWVHVEITPDEEVVEVTQEQETNEK